MGYSCIQKAYVNPHNLGGTNSGFLPEEPNRERTGKEREEKQKTGSGDRRQKSASDGDMTNPRWPTTCNNLSDFLKQDALVTRNDHMITGL